MLRDAMIVLGGLSLGCGLLAGFAGFGLNAIGPVVFGALLLVGTLWERVRYKPLEDGRPGPGWVATDERFVDDESGQPVRVWLQPDTGERRYVKG